ncbi:hypothetical protein LDC_3071, partial [sediment metagenome]
MRSTARPEAKQFGARVEGENRLPLNKSEAIILIENDPRLFNGEMQAAREARSSGPEAQRLVFERILDRVDTNRQIRSSFSTSRIKTAISDAELIGKLNDYVVKTQQQRVSSFFEKSGKESVDIPLDSGHGYQTYVRDQQASSGVRPVSLTATTAPIQLIGGGQIQVGQTLNFNNNVVFDDKKEPVAFVQTLASAPDAKEPFRNVIVPFVNGVVEIEAGEQALSTPDHQQISASVTRVYELTDTKTGDTRLKGIKINLSQDIADLGLKAGLYHISPMGILTNPAEPTEALVAIQENSFVAIGDNNQFESPIIQDVTVKTPSGKEVLIPVRGAFEIYDVAGDEILHLGLKVAEDVAIGEVMLNKGDLLNSEGQILSRGIQKAAFEGDRVLPFIDHKIKNTIPEPVIVDGVSLAPNYSYDSKDGFIYDDANRLASVNVPLLNGYHVALPLHVSIQRDNPQIQSILELDDSAAAALSDEEFKARVALKMKTLLQEMTTDGVSLRFQPVEGPAVSADQRATVQRLFANTRLFLGLTAPDAEVSESNSAKNVPMLRITNKQGETYFFDPLIEREGSAGSRADIGLVVGFNVFLSKITPLTTLDASGVLAHENVHLYHRSTNHLGAARIKMIGQGMPELTQQMALSEYSQFAAQGDGVAIGEAIAHHAEAIRKLHGGSMSDAAAAFQRGRDFTYLAEYTYRLILQGAEVEATPDQNIFSVNVKDSKGNGFNLTMSLPAQEIRSPEETGMTAKDLVLHRLNKVVQSAPEYAARLDVEFNIAQNQAGNKIAWAIKNYAFSKRNESDLQKALGNAVRAGGHFAAMEATTLNAHRLLAEILSDPSPATVNNKGRYIKINENTGRGVVADKDTGRIIRFFSDNSFKPSSLAIQDGRSAIGLDKTELPKDRMVSLIKRASADQNQGPDMALISLTAPTAKGPMGLMTQEGISADLTPTGTVEDFVAPKAPTIEEDIMPGRAPPVASVPSLEIPSAPLQIPSAPAAPSFMPFSSPLSMKNAVIDRSFLGKAVGSLQSTVGSLYSPQLTAQSSQLTISVPGGEVVGDRALLGTAGPKAAVIIPQLTDISLTPLSSNALPMDDMSAQDFANRVTGSPFLNHDAPTALLIARHRAHIINMGRELGRVKTSVSDIIDTFVASSSDPAQAREWVNGLRRFRNLDPAAIKAALKKHNGNQTLAAADPDLGVSTKTLRTYMRFYGIDAQEFFGKKPTVSFSKELLARYPGHERMKEALLAHYPNALAISRALGVKKGVVHGLLRVFTADPQNAQWLETLAAEKPTNRYKNYPSKERMRELVTAHGLDKKQIASALGVGPKTAQKYLDEFMRHAQNVRWYNNFLQPRMIEAVKAFGLDPQKVAQALDVAPETAQRYLDRFMSPAQNVRWYQKQQSLAKEKQLSADLGNKILNVQTLALYLFRNAGATQTEIASYFSVDNSQIKPYFESKENVTLILDDLMARGVRLTPANLRGRQKKSSGPALSIAFNTLELYREYPLAYRPSDPRIYFLFGMEAANSLTSPDALANAGRILRSLLAQYHPDRIRDPRMLIIATQKYVNTNNAFDMLEEIRENRLRRTQPFPSAPKPNAAAVLSPVSGDSGSLRPSAPPALLAPAMVLFPQIMARLSERRRASPHLNNLFNLQETMTLSVARILVGEYLQQYKVNGQKPYKGMTADELASDPAKFQEVFSRVVGELYDLERFKTDDLKTRMFGQMAVALNKVYEANSQSPLPQTPSVSASAKIAPVNRISEMATHSLQLTPSVPGGEVGGDSALLRKTLTPFAVGVLGLLSLGAASRVNAVSDAVAQFYLSSPRGDMPKLASLEAAKAELNQSLNAMIVNMTKTYGGYIIPPQIKAPRLTKIVDGIQGAPTFDNITAAVSKELKAGYAKYNAGRMSALEVDQLAALEEEVLKEVYALWASTPYDSAGVANGEKHVGDLAHVFKGDPHYKDTSRVGIWQSLARAAGMTLYDLGFPSENIQFIGVKKDFLGHDPDLAIVKDKEGNVIGGGHMTLLVHGIKKSYLFDLTERIETPDGQVSLSSINIPHKVLKAPDGTLIDLSKTDLRSVRGETFPEALDHNQASEITSLLIDENNTVGSLFTSGQISLNDALVRWGMVASTVDSLQTHSVVAVAHHPDLRDNLSRLKETVHKNITDNQKAQASSSASSPTGATTKNIDIPVPSTGSDIERAFDLLSKLNDAVNQASTLADYGEIEASIGRIADSLQNSPLASVTTKQANATLNGQPVDGPGAIKAAEEIGMLAKFNRLVLQNNSIDINSQNALGEYESLLKEVQSLSRSSQTPQDLKSACEGLITTVNANIAQLKQIGSIEFLTEPQYTLNLSTGTLTHIPTGEKLPASLPGPGPITPVAPPGVLFGTILPGLVGVGRVTKNTISVPGGEVVSSDPALLTGATSILGMTEVGHTIELKGLVYESYLALQKIQKIQKRAKELGRSVVVVENLSYGAVALAPITVQRNGSDRRYIIGTDIPVISTKIGSSESDGNDIVLRKGLFSQEQAADLLKDKPIVIVVDGSTSVGALTKTNAHIPYAFRGYRNYFMAVNKALSGRIDPFDFQEDEEFVKRLEDQPTFQVLVENLKGQATQISARDNQGYKFAFYYPGQRELYLKSAVDEQKIKVAPRLENVENILGPTVVFMQTAVEPEAVPQEIKDSFIGGSHTPAYFDNTDYFKSGVYVDASRRLFREFLKERGEEIPRESLALATSDDKGKDHRRIFQFREEGYGFVKISLPNRSWFTRFSRSAQEILVLSLRNAMRLENVSGGELSQYIASLKVVGRPSMDLLSTRVSGLVNATLESIGVELLSSDDLLVALQGVGAQKESFVKVTPDRARLSDDRNPEFPAMKSSETRDRALLGKASVRNFLAKLSVGFSLPLFVAASKLNAQALDTTMTYFPGVQNSTWINFMAYSLFLGIPLGALWTISSLAGKRMTGLAKADSLIKVFDAFDRKIKTEEKLREKLAQLPSAYARLDVNKDRILLHNLLGIPLEVLNAFWPGPGKIFDDLKSGSFKARMRDIELGLKRLLADPDVSHEIKIARAKEVISGITDTYKVSEFNKADRLISIVAKHRDFYRNTAVEKYIDLKFAGIEPTEILMSSPLTVGQLTKESRRVRQGGFDINSPIDVDLNYGNLKSDLAGQRDLGYPDFLDMIESIRKGKKFASGNIDDISSHDTVQVKGLVYESYLALEKIREIQKRAKELGRSVVVVENLSYGAVALAPITVQRNGSGKKYIIGTDISVISTKIGSTESHNNEFILREDLFSQEQRASLLKDKPIVIVVDGSASVSDATRTSPHIPDGFKGYRNYFMAVNKALGGQVRPADFYEDQEFVSALEEQPAFNTLIGDLQNQATGLNGTDKQGYKFTFYYPGQEKLYLRVNKQKDIVAPKLQNVSDMTGPTVVFMQTAIEPEAVPQEIMDNFIGGVHKPAYFDDKDNYKRFTLAYEEGYGIVQSRVYVDASRRLFTEFLKQQGKEIPRESFAPAIAFNHPINAVVLDLDGTIAKTDKPLQEPMLERLISLLQKKPVVIITEDISANVNARLVNSLPADVRHNLVIFSDSGAKGYTFRTDGSEVLLSGYNAKSLIDESTRLAVEKIIVEKFNGQIVRDSRTNRLSPDYRIDLRVPDGVDRTKVLSAFQNELNKAGIGAKAYKVGSTSIKVVLQHKDDALRQYLKDASIEPANVLIVGDSAKTGGLDRKMLTAFPAAVSVNVGRYSHSIANENPNIVQLPGADGIQKTYQILTAIDQRGQIPETMLVNATPTLVSDSALLGGAGVGDSALVVR